MPNGTIHTKPGVRNLTYFPNLSTSPRLVGRTVRKEVGNTIKKKIKAITDRAIIQPISNLLFISLLSRLYRYATCLCSYLLFIW
jgi:hypothetical protein